MIRLKKRFNVRVTIPPNTIHSEPNGVVHDAVVHEITPERAIKYARKWKSGGKGRAFGKYSVKPCPEDCTEECFADYPGWTCTKDLPPEKRGLKPQMIEGTTDTLYGLKGMHVLFSRSAWASERTGEVYKFALQDYGNRSGITAIDVGFKSVKGKSTDVIAVRFHVIEKLPESAIRKEDLLPKTVRGVPMDVIQAVYEPANTGD
jgi:hypothetical protein